MKDRDRNNMEIHIDTETEIGRFIGREREREIINQ